MKIREYARHRGVSHAAVQKALKAGRISAEADGSIDPAKADVAWSKNTDASRNPGAPKASIARSPSTKRKPATSTTASDFSKSRAKREAVAAAMAEIELAEKQGSVVSVEKMKAIWFGTLRMFRDRFLQMPDRLGSTLAAEADPTRLKAVLDAEIRRALDDAANEMAKALG